MSRVFVAEETGLGRSVVIKVLPPDLAASLSLDRFRREIHLAASLQHPHIVPLLSAGQAGELLYYTMPLVEGESLRARLRRDGELPVAEAARILRDVADALSYAHRHGVIHRDIKPDNVLLSESHALVTDFGVAKALDEAREQMFEVTVVGKVTLLAPTNWKSPSTSPPPPPPPPPPPGPVAPPLPPPQAATKHSTDHATAMRRHLPMMSSPICSSS